MATVSLRYPRQPLAEDLAGTGSIAASKPSGRKPQLDRHSLPRKVLEIAAVGAVAGSGQLTTKRTPWLPLDVDHKSESVYISFDAVQNQNAGIGEEGLRMAWGRCHRPKSLEHSEDKVFQQ